MLRSLFAGISGLRVNQTMLDVTGNNIANANTIGFKSSTTVFQDTLSQMLTAASGSNANRGGTNPVQIGLGVQVASVNTNFTQGSNETTGVGTDMMINGDGFFVVKDGSNQYYTRAGAFTFDNQGNLVAPDGKYVQGYAVTGYTGGSPATPGTAAAYDVKSADWTAMGNLHVKDNNNDVAVDLTGATDVNDAIAKLNADAGFSSVYTATSDGAGGITVTAKSPYAQPGAAAITGAGATSTLATAGVAATAAVPPSTPTYSSTLSTINRGNNLGAINFPPGARLQSYEIGADGTITGTYDNGQQLAIGKIAIANFSNPDGLEKAGDTEFTESSNSGRAQVGVAGQVFPGTGQNGSLTVGSLEMSNVDLSQEFTNLILAQRGFEASSKVITTSDQVLQDLVDMKR
jgi:flagellar hook protein FlgE